jgi:hypothetical protein
MTLYFDQIPEDEGFSVEDYPEDTVFILDDHPLQRDPKTHQLIPREKRPKVYPPT